MTITSPRFFAERKRIVALAGKYRLPTIYSQKEFVEEGGLMSYGADYELVSLPRSCGPVSWHLVASRKHYYTNEYLMSTYL